ncbi:MAG: NAD(P)/FAD-dependent oxidoreductase [Oscillospiraceae bacterium]|nr:NAD(P)/FAD-dependent oxidoreductase [Oscillospiraceae bacterium]
MIKQTNDTARVCVIGAGASGMTAAVFCARQGVSAVIYERNSEPGRKLLITGKGRCNVTNDSNVRDVIENIPSGGRFLYSAISAFSPSDTIAFFESAGVKLKTERGGRVFPVSDSAKDIRDALVREMMSTGLIEKINARVISVSHTDNGFLVRTAGTERSFGAVIIATGGLSYPKTGSTGDGYDFAKALGHTVTPLYPSLVPLECAGAVCRELMGLSLKNVAVRFYDNGGKCLYEDFGEMLFAHFGVSGPVILSASAKLGILKRGESCRLSIDLKPALDRETLDRRVLNDFSENKNREFSNSLARLLPAKLIPVIVALSGISPEKRVNEITKEERARFVSLLKDFTLTVMGTRPIDEAIITSGGIPTEEINPKTMESLICPRLFFCGEIINCDAYTGGYNLQIAFSTGKKAGESAAMRSSY